ncbi:hypothetical protein LCGC14_2962440, partial [marine sediment metagenome]
SDIKEPGKVYSGLAVAGKKEDSLKME